MKFNVYDYVELRQALSDKMCEIQEKINCYGDSSEFTDSRKYEIYGYQNAIEVIEKFFDKKQLSIAKSSLSSERIRVLNKQADMLLSLEQDNSDYE